MRRLPIHRAAAVVAALALVLGLAARPAPALAADAKEVKLDKAQQAAVDKLRAKGAAVMQIAADTDALAVNLGIVGKGATDEDVALVKTLPKVQQLNLQNTSVTDAGLASVSGLTALTHLHLNGTAVTDAGLASLKGLENLEYLNLYNTAVTDAGVKNLEGLKKLKKLYVWGTKVTPDGAKALKAAVPEIYVNRGEELTLPPPATKPAADPKAGTPVAAGKPVNDKCPVSGKDVDPTKTLVYEGKTIGFCCDMCPKQFEKDPKKFVGKIPALAAPAAEPAKPEPKKPGKKKAAAAAAAAEKAAAADIDAEGFIRTWLVLGVIPVETPGVDVDKDQIAKEGELKPKAGDKVKPKEKELTWQKVTATDYFVDFNEALKASDEMNVAAYAVAYVEAPAEVKDVTLAWCSNDEGKIYLNGKAVGKFDQGRSLEKDADKATGLTLNKGVNVVVLKVINEGNNYQGCARFLGKDGKPVAG
ncbi:MAG TPA: hypothetical protein VF796_12655, partial [Humisphaera sp.]